MTAQDTLREAVAQAKAGHRHVARDMLIELVEIDPQNELAWLWLSTVVEDWDDKIIAVENALTINPDNPKAHARLAQLQQKKKASEGKRRAARTRAQLQEARKAIASGQQKEARGLLLKLLERNPQNDQAWLLLSEVEPEIDDQIKALERAVRLNPRSGTARARLKNLQSVQDDPMALGIMYEEQGRFNQAIDAFFRAQSFARSPAERLEAKKRMEAAQRLAELEGYRPASPTLTLVRMVVGPTLLYVFFVFIQGGLRPTGLSPLLCMGTFSVLFGSFLIFGVHARPRHPIWASVLGPVWASDWIRSFVLWVLGLLCLLAPYLALLASAFLRLNDYRDSLLSG